MGYKWIRLFIGILLVVIEFSCSEGTSYEQREQHLRRKVIIDRVMPIYVSVECKDDIIRSRFSSILKKRVRAYSDLVVAGNIEDAFVHLSLVAAADAYRDFFAVSIAWGYDEDVLRNSQNHIKTIRFMHHMISMGNIGSIDDKFAEGIVACLDTDLLDWLRSQVDKIEISK